MIQTKSIEVFSEASNRAVVRMPGRRFPGVVIQGDSLSLLVSAARLVREGVPQGGALQETANELFDLLSGYLAHYESVLAENGIELPYSRPD